MKSFPQNPWETQARAVQPLVRSTVRVTLYNYILLSIGVCFSAAVLKLVPPAPYLWIAACWVLLCGILMFKSTTSSKKAIWFNLLFLALVAGMLEASAYFSDYDESNYRAEGDSEGYYTVSEALGYAPAKNYIRKSKRFYNEELLYDVTYTIGEDGLRITPQAENDRECLLFFGGSYTYGDGVKDHESMPYVVGTLQKRKVHNFGFHGYGPHQMLSAIQNGMVRCNPKLIIYQALVRHIARSAGQTHWDKRGPKYVLRDGHLESGGHFDDEVVSFLEKKIETQLIKSSFYKKYFRNVYGYTDHDIELLLEIVDASRLGLLRDHPTAKFEIILWDRHPEDETYKQMKSGFAARSIKIHLVSDILPGFPEEIARYEISEYDTHPSALAHRLIAEYIVEELVE